LEFSRRAAGALDIAWAKILLRRLEEKDFPIQSAQNLKEKLGRVWLSGRSVQEVLEELDYPIHTPIELIEKIKENLRMYGLE
jgi:predicted transcriptional regulator